MDTLGNWQLAQPLASLDESSDLTTALSPAEILKLNRQHRRDFSPSDRLRLFSFTKRHLKLPFLARGKKHHREGRVEDASTPPNYPSPGRKEASPVVVVSPTKKDKVGGVCLL